MTRRILSIDGGGVRGIIPAVALAALERRVGGRVRDHFDFLAGTSTGALISGAAASGVAADRLVTLYTDKAAGLFRKVPVVSTLRRIVFGHMYDVADLHRLISDELGDAANIPLNDLPRDILITAKGLWDSRPWYFVRDHPGRNSARTGSFGLSDCLTASAAAPTYFAPWTMKGIEGELVDGGTGVAGNPVYQACVEAFVYTDGYSEPDTIIVSMGTGHYLGRTRPTWIYSWLHWLLGELLRSPGEQQTALVDRHFQRARFYRIDVKLDDDVGLDDAGQMAALREIGERLAARIDWQGVLAGSDTEWLVTRHRRRPGEYAEAV